MAALARIAGPLRVLITASLVEHLVRNVGAYAVNAVAGAAQGRTLTVPMGSVVIACSMTQKFGPFGNILVPMEL
jgi:hypothetical protein